MATSPICGLWIDPRIYGDGSLSGATLQAMLTALGSQVQTVLLVRGTWNVSQNLVFPSNLRVIQEHGAVMNITTGFTVTFNGPYTAYLETAFSGLGSVVFGQGSVTEVPIQWFGAKGDGVTASGAALNSAVSSTTGSGGTVLISPGSYLVDVNVTVPTNVNLTFREGAQLSINTAITVTINGGLVTPIVRIFLGAGAVVFGATYVREIYPAYFGARGDGVTGSAAAINSANASIATTGGAVVFPPGTYIIDANVTFGSNIQLVMQTGARLSINASQTVTINGTNNFNIYQVFTGAGSVLLGASLREVLPQWWGLATSSAVIQLALNAIGSTNQTLVLTAGSGQWSITGNLTIPSNVWFKIEQGASVSVSTGFALTINGPFEAPPTRVFSGAGSVVLAGPYLGEVPVGWFGLTNDGRTVTDGVMTAGSAVLTSATATFTALDAGKVIGVRNAGALSGSTSSTTASINAGTAILTVGLSIFTASDTNKYITVAGAGAGGVALTSYIGIVTSATQVTLKDQALSNVTNVTATWSTTSGLFTTIATFQSATQVTLTASASIGVSSATVAWGTDNASVISSAYNAISAAGGTITVPAGNYAIGGALTVPTSVRLRMLANAKLYMAASTTMTINGTFEAPLSQVFVPVGLTSTKFGISAVPWITPTYWGATNDLSADAWPGIMSAINALPTNGGTIRFLPGDYALYWTILISGVVNAAARFFKFEGVCGTGLATDVFATVRLKWRGITGGTILELMRTRESEFKDISLTLHDQNFGVGIDIDGDESTGLLFKNIIVRGESNNPGIATGVRIGSITGSTGCDVNGFYDCGINNCNTGISVLGTQSKNNVLIRSHVFSNGQNIIMDRGGNINMEESTIGNSLIRDVEIKAATDPVIISRCSSEQSKQLLRAVPAQAGGPVIVKSTRYVSSVQQDPDGSVRYASGGPLILEGCVFGESAVSGIYTTLTGSHDAVTTTITVPSTTGFPAPGTPVRFIVIENEAISYTAMTATTFSGGVRGYNSTTAAAHAGGVNVSADTGNIVRFGFSSPTTPTQVWVTGCNFSNPDPLRGGNPALANGGTSWSSSYWELTEFANRYIDINSNYNPLPARYTSGTGTNAAQMLLKSLSGAIFPGGAVAPPVFGQNLRQTFAATGAGVLFTVTLTNAEPDVNYFPLVVPFTQVGTPAVGSSRLIGIGAISATSFQFNVEVAPGVGATQNWLVFILR